MANATKTIKPYDRSTGSPLEATSITVANGADWFDDDAIPASKVDSTQAIVPADLDSGVVGTATGPVVAVGAATFAVVGNIASGATANDVVTGVMPRKGKLIGIRTIKTSANSGNLANAVSVRDTAAGGGALLASSVLATWDGAPALVVLPDTAVSPINTVDDSAAATLAAGATLFFCRAQTGGDNAALVVLEFMPLD